MEDLKNGSNKKIDDSAGSLVWVRRGNGSWWPGKVLAPEELPEESLISTKSGRPVILLGKEDESLEWYDLDTSNRVKAFRCGEFKTCIEKAESIALNKSRKYTNREVAIVTALELESARVGDKKDDSNSDPDLPQSGTSFEDLNTLEDDETDVAKLASNGLDRSSLKRKRSQRIAIKSKTKGQGLEWQTKGRRSSRRKPRKGRKLKAVRRFIYADSFTWGRNLDSKPKSLSLVKKLSGSTRSNQKPPRPSKPYVQTLYDVPVEVDSSCSRRPNHVPYISLMSKTNDRPIVGHPVEVEAIVPVVSCVPVASVFSRLSAALNI